MIVHIVFWCLHIVWLVTTSRLTKLSTASHIYLCVQITGDLRFTLLVWRDISVSQVLQKLSSLPRTNRKYWDWWLTLVIPALGRERQTELRGSLVSLMDKANERPPPSKTRWTAFLRNSIQGCPLASMRTCIHMHAYQCTCVVCRYEHAQTQISPDKFHVCLSLGSRTFTDDRIQLLVWNGIEFIYNLHRPPLSVSFKLSRSLTITNWNTVLAVAILCCLGNNDKKENLFMFTNFL